MDIVIRFSFYFLFFLVPLVFTAQTSELFEYNKMMLTYGLTVVIIAAWGVKMVAAKKFIYRRTFLEIPLLLYLGSHLLSTIFSIDPHVSFWGYYSRFHEGMLASTCYVLLYFAAVSNLNFRHVKKILLVSFISAALVSLWGVLEHFGHSPSCLIITGNFGVDCWIQDVKNRVFATLGQPNWMAAYLCVIILMTPGYVLSIKNYAILLPLFLAALYATKSRSGFLALGVGLAYFFILVVKIPWRVKMALCLLGVVFSLGFAVFRYQNTPPPSANSITDSETIRKPVWEGAIKVWQRYPVFGSGVETFAYSFYQDRPVSKNLDSEWDFLYNKAHNEYFNLLATTGTVGILTYFLFIGSFIYFILIVSQNSASKGLTLRSYNSPWLILGLFAGWITILVTNYYGFSIVIIGLYFFLIPAFCFLLTDQQETIPLPAKEIDTFGFCSIGLIVFLAFMVLLNLLNMYHADKAYALGKNLDSVQQYLQAKNYLDSSMAANPDEPTFRDELAFNQSVLAAALFDQIKTATASSLASLSAQEKLNLTSPQLGESVNSLVAKSLQNSDQVVTTSPASLPFWKNRTKTFYQLAAIDEKYYLNALEAITAASKLAPTDAKVWYNLALLQARAGQVDTAIKTLEKTILMKPDYTDAIKAKEQLSSGKNP